MKCKLSKKYNCNIIRNKNKTCCKNNKLGNWCWSKNTTKSCSQMRKNMKCRLIRGKNETCCINPIKGHWCWSNETPRKTINQMKYNCCK